MNPLNRPAFSRFLFTRVISKDTIVSMVSGLFFILFVFAAAIKFTNYEAFGNQIAQTPLLAPFANYLVWLVPVIELMIAGLLLSSRTLLTGLYACCSLMMLFSICTTLILVFAQQIPSLNGIIANLEYKNLLLFNVALVMLALAGITFRTKIETRYNFY